MIDDTYPTFSCMYESYQEISKVRTLVLELERSVRCWGCHFVLVSKFNKHLDAKGRRHWTAKANKYKERKWRYKSRDMNPYTPRHLFSFTGCRAINIIVQVRIASQYWSSWCKVTFHTHWKWPLLCIPPWEVPNIRVPQEKGEYSRSS